MRRRTFTLALAAIATMTLAGCSANGTADGGAQPAGSASQSAAPAAAASPTPTPTPTEIVLTENEAGALYLDLICDVNASGLALNTAFDEKEQEFLNGGTPDPAGIKAAAAARIEVNRMGLEVLDDDFYVWPTSVRESIGHIRDYYVAELATLNAIANTSSYEDAYYMTFDQTPEQKSAGQNLRYELGLSTDTVASCQGHEGKLTALHEETTVRAANEG